MPAVDKRELALLISRILDAAEYRGDERDWAERRIWAAVDPERLRATRTVRRDENAETINFDTVAQF